MQRWIASLTLLAYLIGGWALPTIHHHGVDATTAVHGEVGCHAHEHAAPVESAHDELHPVCSHPCKSEGHVDTQELPSVPTTGFAFRSADVEDCHGLCALCVTSSLCSQRLAEPGISTGIALVGRTFLAEPRFLLQLERGNVSSRGPPLFV